MLTKRDRSLLLKEFKEVFVTRTEFHEGMQGLRSELKNDILNFKDSILGEILAMREELAVVIGYRQKIEDHEERITSVEKIVSRQNVLI